MPTPDQKGTIPAVNPELHQIIKTRKIPNALLFTGPTGTGKTEAAFVFAMGVNCLGPKQNAPCRECRSCKKILDRMHPDIIQVQSEEKKKNIAISQIRDMGMQISTRPNEARHRMILIHRAEQMNVQAQNALLKLLEEPPENTFFILLTPDASQLLDTIRSRCRTFRFKPLTGTGLTQYLAQHHGVSLEQAAIAAGTAGSDQDQAARLLHSDPDQGVDWIHRRQWIIKELTALMKPRPQPPVARALAFSQKLVAQPDATLDSLAVIQSVFRDLMVLPLGVKKIVNLDFFDTFTDISQIIEYDRILKWMDHLYETEKRLTSNASPRLTFDRFFLGICLDEGYHIL